MIPQIFSDRSRLRKIANRAINRMEVIGCYSWFALTLLLGSLCNEMNMSVINRRRQPLNGYYSGALLFLQLI